MAIGHLLTFGLGNYEGGGGTGATAAEIFNYFNAQGVLMSEGDIQGLRYRLSLDGTQVSPAANAAAQFLVTTDILSSGAESQINAQLDTAIEDYRLDELIFTAAGTAAANSLWSDLLASASTPPTNWESMQITSEGIVISNATNQPAIGLTTTVASVVTPGSVYELASGDAADDAYNNLVIRFSDTSTPSNTPIEATVLDYNGTTKHVTVDINPSYGDLMSAWTITTGDGVQILGSSSGGGGDNSATIYTYFTSDGREDVFKATLDSITGTVDANVVSYADSLTIPSTVAISKTNELNTREPLVLVQNKDYLDSNSNRVKVRFTGDLLASLASCDDGRLTIRNMTDSTNVVDRVASHEINTTTGYVYFELDATDTDQSASDEYKYMVELRHGTDYLAAIIGNCVFESDLNSPIA